MTAAEEEPETTVIPLHPARMQVEAGFLPVPKDIPVNGKLIRHRTEQQAGWLVASAVTAILIVSGAYYALTQVKYPGLDGRTAFYLKPMWDGLLVYGWWPLYRHGIRGLLEGALATPLAKSLSGAWKKRPFKRIPDWMVPVQLLVLFVVSLALAIGGLWILTFGIAMIRHHSVHVAYVTPSPREQELVFFAIGLVVGQVAHRLWRPAGNSIQLFFVERGADFWHRTGRLPWWVRHPVVPPGTRERTSWTIQRYEALDEAGLIEHHGGWFRRVIPLGAAIAFILFWVGAYARLIAAYGGWHAALVHFHIL